MAFVYPESPKAIPADFARPSGAYHRHAILATVALLAFMALYLAAAGYLAWKAATLLSSAGGSFAAWVVGGCAAFLAIFMAKGLVFVRRGADTDGTEIIAEQEPALFQFIHRLADEAGAPRPARVFLSPRVNAAVFYDISILNLLFPSRKNLEIGLGLVNVLTVEEFKAVLAHEFGHFGQRSMLIGRWVYIGQQIAAALVARRDVLDRLLQGISRFDVRIAWVGWVMSLIVWSIRALTDSAFRLVMLAQRALSREMEMQADLVAVSLTGSDALVHALHKVGAAEEAWDRAIAFANGELQRGRSTPDIFEIQTRIIERLRAILDEPHYGRAPARPAENAQKHRVFTAQLAEPSRMWATHPSNNEREENAKRTYIAMPLGRASAWELFANPEALRQRTSRGLAKDPKSLPPPASREDAVRALEKQFEHESFKRFYRGAYIGRAIARRAKTFNALYDPLDAKALEQLARLYPDSLAADLKRLRVVSHELASLEAVRDGWLEPPGGVIRHRGRVLARRQLKVVILGLRRERDALRQRIDAHDRACRTAHRMAAKACGGGWESLLTGLVAVIHYAEHTAADLRDLMRVAINVVTVETAARRVDKKGLARILDAAAEVQAALQQVYDQSALVRLPSVLLEKIGGKSWPQQLGTLQLQPPVAENINDWYDAAGGWVDAVANALDNLRNAALADLLVGEATVARAFAAKQPPPAAPEAPRVPAEYPVLPIDAERPLQTRLGWWARFLRADGPAAEVARFAVAAAIAGSVLLVSGDVGRATIVVHNDLERLVTVQLGDQRVSLAPGGTQRVEVPPGKYAVRTTLRDGSPVETFDASIERAQAHVYNVAAATPLVEWTAVYGEGVPSQRFVGAKRWIPTAADFIFQPPPASISGRKGSKGGTRLVLSGTGSRAPDNVLSLGLAPADREAIILAHVRWDDTAARDTIEWLRAGRTVPRFEEVLAQRLKQEPNDPLLLRTEQDSASEAVRPLVCARHASLAERNPANPDLRYASIRCLPPGEERDRAFIEAFAAAPSHPYLALAAGHTHADQRRWAEAAAALERAFTAPALREQVALDLARVRRMAERSPALEPLAKESERLRVMLAVERGNPPDAQWRPYVDLAKGNLRGAIASASGEMKTRVIRLVGASEGADLADVERALSVRGTEGLDAASVWSAWALASRAGRDTSAYRDFAASLVGNRTASAFQSFLSACKLRDLAEAENALRGQPIELTAQAYVMGVMLLGDAAPASWRETAKRMLFPIERPYFL